MISFAKSMKLLMGIFSKTPPLKPLLKVDIDYCFTEVMLDEWINAIHLLTTPWTGIVYYYGHVKIIPQPDGTNRLAYQYTIWNPGAHTKEVLAQSKEFQTHIGDVLVAIIANEQGSGELHVPSRNDDSQESHL